MPLRGHDEGMSFVGARRLVAGDNPFIGLRPFGVADADVFFGREAQVATLLARLGDTRFLAVVGASGCGKSSLVLAGVIPALARGALGAGSSWRVATMRPGSAPLESLATVLARTQALGEQADDPGVPRARMLGALQRGDRGLVDLVTSARLRDDENLLVVVDQFEELFRYASTADPVRASPRSHGVREPAADRGGLAGCTRLRRDHDARGLHRRLRAVCRLARSDQRQHVSGAAPESR